MRSIFLSLLLAAAVQVAAAQQRLDYEVAFPNAAHHEAEITLTVHDAPSRPLTFWMSRSSPGRYALHEFAKNVYSVYALDSKGDTLKVTRPNPYSWEVAEHGGTVKVHYTLYANHADGTYAGIDRTHAHFNMPAGFMWVMGMEDQPMRVHFTVPAGSGWKAATQLKPTDDPYTFTAPDLDYFMDSPTELSNYKLRTWDVRSGSRTEHFRLALHDQGTEKQADRYAEMAERIVREEMQVFGELPDYDYGTYTFLADYLPWVYGDGMEHRNSTIVISSHPLATGAMDNLGTLAHEFIHCWNMERIRSSAIQPFDFTRANMSKELWFGEGFTSYYTELVQRRAGFLDDDGYGRNMGRTINYVINMPGREYFSAVQMSEQAPFVDAATSIDDQNKENTFISYYTWGSAIGMGLDLTLRTRYPGLTLDDYMQAMWRKYGKTGVHYDMGDLQHTLGELTGDPAFARSFFDKYVRGHQVVDYKSLLAHAGFDLQPAHPARPFLGYGNRILEFRDGKAYVSSNTIKGTSFYQAGMDQGDVLLSVNGTKIDSPKAYGRMLSRLKPGEQVTVKYHSRGSDFSKDVTVAQDPGLTIVPFEKLGKSVTPEMKKFRADWLETKVEQ